MGLENRASDIQANEREVTDPHVTIRTWLVDILPEEVRMRCAYKRRGRRIVQYTVQLEVRHLEAWHPVVRYDNAHGFCHRDVLHPDGSQDKTPVMSGGANETFTFAIDELRANWEAHTTRFLREAKS